MTPSAISPFSTPHRSKSDRLEGGQSLVSEFESLLKVGGESDQQSAKPKVLESPHQSEQRALAIDTAGLGDESQDQKTLTNPLEALISAEDIKPTKQLIASGAEFVVRDSVWPPVTKEPLFFAPAATVRASEGNFSVSTPNAKSPTVLAGKRQDNLRSSVHGTPDSSHATDKFAAIEVKKGLTPNEERGRPIADKDKQSTGVAASTIVPAKPPQVQSPDQISWFATDARLHVSIADQLLNHIRQANSPDRAAPTIHTKREAISGDLKELKLRFDPIEFGHLKVRMLKHGDGMRIIVETETTVAHERLSLEQQSLRRSLEEQGISVSEISFHAPKDLGVDSVYQKSRDQNSFSHDQGGSKPKHARPENTAPPTSAPEVGNSQSGDSSLRAGRYI